MVSWNLNTLLREVLRHPLLILWRFPWARIPLNLANYERNPFIACCKGCSGCVPKLCWNNLRVWRLGKKNTHDCVATQIAGSGQFSIVAQLRGLTTKHVNKVDYTLKSSIQHIVIIKNLDLFIKKCQTDPKNPARSRSNPSILSCPTTKESSHCPTKLQGLMNVHTLAIRSSESFNIPPGKPKNFLSEFARGRKEAKAWIMVNLPFPEPPGPLGLKGRPYDQALCLTIGFP